MRQFTALVVDDNATTRILLKHILSENFGCAVRMAGNGLEAIERLREELPDVVFLDVVMPGMNGVETLREMRSSFGELPVFVVSSSRDTDTVHAMVGMNVEGYFLKPIRLADVRERLKDFFAKLPAKAES